MNRIAAALLLAGVLAAAWWFLAHRPGGGRDGTGRYRRWAGRAVATFLLPTLVALALLGRLDALWTLPPELAALRRWLPAMALAELVTGALSGTAIGLVAAGFRARRGGRPLGGTGALMPRHRRELRYGAMVAIVAGTTEEAFFRLLLPLLTAIVTGSAVLGCLLATMLFGAMHLYQGWRGVAGTTVFGGVMAALYVMSGALWLAVLVHTLIDLGALLLWPALARDRAGRRWLA